MLSSFIYIAEMAGADGKIFLQEKAMVLDELKHNQLNLTMIPTASNLRNYMIFNLPTWTSFYG
jgi:hypothetical protein